MTIRICFAAAYIRLGLELFLPELCLYEFCLQRIFVRQVTGSDSINPWLLHPTEAL